MFPEKEQCAGKRTARWLLPLALSIFLAGDHYRAGTAEEPVLLERYVLQVVDGGKGVNRTHTTFRVANPDDAPADVTIRAYRDDGSPWTLATTDGSWATKTYTIDPGEMLGVRTNGKEDVCTGYARITSTNPDISITANYALPGMAEITVPAVQEGMHTALQIEVGETTNTGFADVNTSAESDTHTYTLYNTDGVEAARWMRTLQPGERKAIFLTQVPEAALFVKDGFIGSMAVTSAMPHSAVALRETDAGNSIHYAALAGQQSGESTAGGQHEYWTPQIVDGGGYSTELKITNLDVSSLDLTISFHRPDGTPWTLQTSGGTAGQFSFTGPQSIPPQGSRIIKTAGSGRLAAGYARATANSSAFLMKTIYAIEGAGEVSVARTEPAEESHIQVEDAVGECSTAYALVNASSTPNTIRLILTNAKGEFTAERERKLEPGEHRAEYLYQTFGDTIRDHKGVLSIVSRDGEHVAVGLRENEEIKCFVNVGGTFKGYDPNRVKVIASLHDLALLKNVNLLHDTEGVTPVIPGATITIGNRAKYFRKAATKFWLEPGTYAADARHPQYWDDITIARTNPATWSTISWKDANNLAVTLTLDAALRGKEYRLALLQMRDLEQFHYRVDTIAMEALPLPHYIAKRDVLSMLMPHGTNYGFFDPQNIPAFIPSQGHASNEGIIGIQVICEMVAYQNTLSPLTRITVIDLYPDYETAILFFWPSDRTITFWTPGSQPWEIRTGMAGVNCMEGEGELLLGAAAGVLAATTRATDLYVAQEHRLYRIGLGNILFGLPAHQATRGQPFNEIGVQIAGLGLNLDRGIAWNP